MNIGDMLDNGTVMNGKLIESPKSFQVGLYRHHPDHRLCGLNQYGGQSVDMSHLGKYLRRSRRSSASTSSMSAPDRWMRPRIERLVDDRVRDELKCGVQTISTRSTPDDHQRTVPFVTLFLNLREGDPYLEENARIVEEVLAPAPGGHQKRGRRLYHPRLPQAGLCAG
ncbi:MAG: anaerobic ribonucleoside-triphosphate reductase [Lawsonibacter sp.]